MMSLKNPYIVVKKKIPTSYNLCVLFSIKLTKTLQPVLSKNLKVGHMYYLKTTVMIHKQYARVDSRYIGFGRTLNFCIVSKLLVEEDFGSFLRIKKDRSLQNRIFAF